MHFNHLTRPSDLSTFYSTIALVFSSLPRTWYTQRCVSCIHTYVWYSDTNFALPPSSSRFISRRMQSVYLYLFATPFPRLLTLNECGYCVRAFIFISFFFFYTSFPPKLLVISFVQRECIWVTLYGNLVATLFQPVNFALSFWVAEVLWLQMSNSLFEWLSIKNLPRDSHIFFSFTRFCEHSSSSIFTLGHIFFCDRNYGIFINSSDRMYIEFVFKEITHWSEEESMTRESFVAVTLDKIHPLCINF